MRAHAIAVALQQAAIDRAPQERRRAAEHAPGLAMERTEGDELGGPDLTPKGPQGGEAARSPAGRELDSAGGLRDADGLEEVVRDLETRLERQEALRLRAERVHGSLAAHNAALRAQVQDLVAQNREMAASRPGSAAGSRPGSAAPRGAASGPPRPHAAGMVFPDAAALARGGGLQPPPSSRAALASGSPPHRPPAEGRRVEPLRGVHRAWDGGAAPGGGLDAPKATEPRSNGSSGFSGPHSPPARRTFRPASASAAGRWGGGGAPGAGGGGFGVGSLASRAVYVGRPARGAPGDGAAPALSPGPPGPGSPGKGCDELFSREHAQRLLRHSALAPNVGGRAEGPGSAGRAGTARPRSSHAERLLHREADAFLGFHSAPAPPAGGGPDHALQVLVAMRARAAAKYVRVADFMAPYDRLRRGTVSSGEFRRALDACGCFGEMSEEDHAAVVSLFAVAAAAVPAPARPATAGGARRPPEIDRVGYAAFCEVVQPAGDSRAVLGEGQRLLQALVRQRAEGAAGGADSALVRNALSREGESKLRDVTARVLLAVRAARVPVRDLLAPFDLRGGGARDRPLSAAQHHAPGCISRSQFLRGMQSGALGARFSEQELALLFCRYERGGEFNYFLFCRDLERAQESGLDHVP